MLKVWGCDIVNVDNNHEGNVMLFVRTRLILHSYNTFLGQDIDFY